MRHLPHLHMPQLPYVHWQRAKKAHGCAQLAYLVTEYAGWHHAHEMLILLVFTGGAIFMVKGIEAIEAGA